MTDLSIVLPAHNEEELLESTVNALRTGLQDFSGSWEMWIVENGSSDRTLEIANSLSERLSGVSVVSLPVGDYGAALREGFDRSQGEYVVNFDVDYYDLEFMKAAIALCEERSAAIVVASKRAEGSDDQRSLFRRVLTACFTGVLVHGFKMPVSDAHGMKVLQRKALEPFVSHCQMTGSLFDVELVIRAVQAGLLVLELPVVVVELRSPRSSVARRVVEALGGLIRLKRALRA